MCIMIFCMPVPHCIQMVPLFLPPLPLKHPEYATGYLSAFLWKSGDFFTTMTKPYSSLSLVNYSSHLINGVMTQIRSKRHLGLSGTRELKKKKKKTYSTDHRYPNNHLSHLRRKKKKEKKIRTSSSPVSPQERQRLGESGGGRRCFAVKPHQRCFEATSSHSLSSGSRTHARTFAHARTHRGGDGALHHAGELMIWNLLHKRTCDGSPTCRVLPLLVLLFLRRLISGRLALLRVSDRGVLMRILRQWWRTRPKTGRFSISKLWWVSDEVIDGVWRHVSAHDGIFFFFFFMDVVVGPGRMRLPAAHPRPVWEQEEAVCGFYQVFLHVAFTGCVLASLCCFLSFTLIHRCCVTLSLLPGPTSVIKSYQFRFHQTMSDSFVQLEGMHVQTISDHFMYGLMGHY